MREIKFRAWSPDKKQMTYLDSGYVSEGLYYHEKGTHTLMQYTGVNDMQGVPVFEGDIVEAELQNDYGSFEFVTAKVVWIQEGLGCFTIDTIGDTGTGYGGMFRLNKVIGNVWENPELIKS